MDIHVSYMERCMVLAQRGEGFVMPNPLVGAVLVHEGRIIGEGWHTAFGEPHAEVACLRSVSAAHRHLIPQSTLYVSLEPCAHFGKTPPCADLIIREGIPRVVVGAVDPFKEVAGKGIARLRQAGVEVVEGVLKEACEWQNRRFFHFHQSQMPWVHLKWAATSDGFMGTAAGSPLKISGPVADRWVHRLRAAEAAIMVGAQTAIADNPLLTNRFWGRKQPVRVVAAGHTSLPANARLFAAEGRVLILHAFAEKREGNVVFLHVPEPDIHAPEAILHMLYAQGLQSVLVEGGARLLQSFIAEGCWNEATVITNTDMAAGAGVAAPVLTGAKLVSSWGLGSHRVTRFIKS